MLVVVLEPWVPLICSMRASQGDASGRLLSVTYRGRYRTSKTQYLRVTPECPCEGSPSAHARRRGRLNPRAPALVVLIALLSLVSSAFICILYRAGDLGARSVGSIKIQMKRTQPLSTWISRGGLVPGIITYSWGYRYVAPGIYRLSIRHLLWKLHDAVLRVSCRGNDPS